MRKQKLVKALLPSVIAAVAMTQTPAIMAQSSLSIEEIVVTAQKREQSLQDVGITISAFDGEAMAAMGVVNSNEVAAKTPNLNIVSPAGEGGVVSVFIRGIGLNDFALNNTGPVGFYVDETSIGSSNGQLTMLFDVDRVEVLKGPQGTLFGRNTTGGALNIVSNRPTDEFEGGVKWASANDGYRRAEAVVSGSLTDELNARAALVGSRSDGYIVNVANDNRVGKQNYAGRVLLDYLPTDELSVLLNLHASRNDSDSDLYGRTTDEKFYESDVGDKEYRINVDTRGASLNVNLDLNHSVSFTSITAYDDLDKLHSEEGDTTPLELLEFIYDVNSHTFSQELRFNGDSESLHWIAGLYYLSETTNWGVTGGSNDLMLVPGLPLGMTGSDGHQKLETKALFGQVEYELSERAVLTLGARYTHLDVDFSYDSSIPNFGYTPLPSSLSFADDLVNEELSGKLALNYYATEDHMLYGSITQGFKGGGFNGGVVSDFASYAEGAKYEPETLLAYELGLKSTLLNNTLRANAAVFFYDYKDAQVFNSIADAFTSLPQNRIENADALELYGLDVELVWQPFEALYLQAGVGYTHSEFKQFGLSVPSFTGVEMADLSGVTPQNTPQWNANLLANYSWLLSGGARVSAQVDASYQSDVLFSNGTVTSPGDPQSYTRNEELGQQAYSLWNARLSWSDATEQVEVALWGKNLTDKQYAAYMFELTDVIDADQVMRGAPRSYGVDLSYHF